MDLLNFMWGMLVDVFSFIFHIFLFSMPVILLVDFLFKKNTDINERIRLYTYVVFGIFVGPGLAVYFSMINPQVRERFYDKLWRYNATEIKIEFAREPTHGEVQNTLASIAQAFPNAHLKYPSKRVITRRGGSMPRRVGTAKSMPTYWKKEGSTLMVYLSEELSQNDLDDLNNDFSKRFFNDKNVLSKNMTLTLLKTLESLTFGFIVKKKTPFSINHQLQIESIDRRLLVYPKEYFNSAELNKEFDKPTAECSVKFIINDDYWSTLLQSTTDSIFNDKNQTAKIALKLKDANKNEIQLVLRHLFFNLKFKAEFSNGVKYPASIYMSEKEQSHLVITIKKYYDDIFRASDTEHECYSMIKEIPIFYNAYVKSHFLSDFSDTLPMRNISVQSKKFSPFYSKVAELKIKPKNDEVSSDALLPLNMKH